MSHAKEIRNANLRELLVQHWEHYRHIETERYWFMSVYTAVIGVVLSLIFRTDTDIEKFHKIWLILFLIALTFIGFFINIRWKQTLELLGKQIKIISDKLGGMPDTIERVKFEAPPKGIFEKLRTRNLFLFFYILVFTGLVIQLVNTLISS